ncbi:MAG: DNA mismatch repair protein MutS, partial [Clostridia bacterium]|nr:DNA mismatch repair protein MutS [Clostridia bacterium]
ITEELKEIEDKVLGSSEKAIALELKIFDDVKKEVSAYIHQLQSTSRNIAILDTLLSFAVVALENNYCKPVISGDCSTHIVEGRHPVVEKLLKRNEFVPNDCSLDCSQERMMIITGPNMAGKSTYMRQVALITLMAHMGSYVPAKSANIALADRIFTRIGASDDLSYGQSTFMVEMIEVATILQRATATSLVILDEIGRGTSTFDGLSIAGAVVEDIAKRIKCKTLFSTHYHELTELEGKIEGVQNYKVTAAENKNTVIFLHKIMRGGTNKSFGIEVASLAGIPKSVITRAKEISKRLENSPLSIDRSDDKAENLVTICDNNTFRDKLRAIDMDNLSPLQ